MEVDNDIEGQLLQQFSCMGTQDKEVLITQFQNLLGNQLNPECCSFYLDMNNWNLQAAIGSYYDYEQQSQTAQVPCMVLVQDITIGEGESIPPITPFVKTWRVKNNGQETWPPGCCLKFIQGEKFGDRERVMVDTLQPGSITDISVEMRSPAATGIYQGQWRMQTTTGMFFGEMIWVILQVEEHGLLGVTQQLSTFGSDLGHHPVNQPLNPFGSPSKPVMSETGESSSSGFVPAGQLSPVVGSLFGSPTPSLVAQHGSLPSSPASAGALPPQGSGASPGSAVCTSLFQGNADPSEIQPNNITVNYPTPPSSEMDSSDML